MNRSFTSASFTTEFGHEFEAERMAWLRRRFLWYMGVSSFMNLVGVLTTADTGTRISVASMVAQYTMHAIGLLVHVGGFIYVWRRRAPRVPVLTLVYWMIVGLGALVLLTSPMVVGSAGPEMREAIRERMAEPPTSGAPAAEAPPAAAPGGVPAKAEAPTPRQQRRERAFAAILGSSAGVATIFGSHFFACVFLPWTSRESLRPMVPLIGLNAVVTFGYMVSAMVGGIWSWGIFFAAIGMIALSFLVPLPGMAVCYWRHNRFRHRFTFDALRGRYSELRQELTNARQIHESLFPGPLASGPVRFDYTYEPMRQIGGDYLHAVVAPASDGTGPARYSFVIVDVTGHGIPAALTVNRLHGELARIFAENPAVPPGDVLRLLNSYVHLTLATHSVYVTAICLRVDPEADTLEYASGGHPPAFVKAVDGSLEQLDSTALVLGAAAGGDFRSDARSIRFCRGDVVVAYTDGATEARDHQGRYFGIAGLQRIMAMGQPDLDGGWPRTILRAVEQYRYGPTADDILVIEVRRPLDAATLAVPVTAAAPERKAAPVSS